MFLERIHFRKLRKIVSFNISRFLGSKVFNFNMSPDLYLCVFFRISLEKFLTFCEIKLHIYIFLEHIRRKEKLLSLKFFLLLVLKLPIINVFLDFGILHFSEFPLRNLLINYSNHWPQDTKKKMLSSIFYILLVPKLLT